MGKCHVTGVGRKQSIQSFGEETQDEESIWKTQDYMEN